MTCGGVSSNGHLDSGLKAVGISWIFVLSADFREIFSSGGQWALSAPSIFVVCLFENIPPHKEKGKLDGKLCEISRANLNLELYFMGRSAKSAFETRPQFYGHY
jgi:hypothetical protein